MNPLPGRVYFGKKFEFPNGEKRDKYLVVMYSDPDDSDWVYVATTTSVNRSEPVLGCYLEHPACFFVPDENTPLKGETRVMLSDLYYVEFDYLKLRCEFKGEFDIGITTSILECGSHSETLSGYERKQLKSEADLIR